MIITDIQSFRENLPYNKKLVVTNGCFDLLHSGHVHYLNEAKSFGNYLMVGINSDLSVKKLKGNNRPINSEYHRAFILDNLKCVDFVYIFNEVRCVEFLKLARPTIYVKGGDYTMDTIDQGEKASLEASNSLIKFIKFKFDLSTTEILSKIKT